MHRPRCIKLRDTRLNTNTQHITQTTNYNEQEISELRKETAWWGNDENVWWN